MGSLPVSTKMELGIFRNGMTKNVIVELKASLKTSISLGDIYTGVEGADLSDYSLNGQKGVKIENVKLNTQASKIGFKKDDIIVEVNQKLINNLNDLKNILDLKPNILVFSVKRGSNSIYLVSE